MTNRNKFKPSDFVHLHNHSHYSVLDGLQKIPEMVEKVAQLGMKSVALTDHGNLSGLPDLDASCKKYDIKPIYGLEAYVTDSSRKHTDKQGSIDRVRYHLVLLAMNDEGLKNLKRLATISNVEGFYYKPRIDRDLLQKYGQGLIVLSGCLGSEIGKALLNNYVGQAEKIAKWYKENFPNRYYLEIQDHDTQKQKKVNRQIIGIGKKLGIDVVLTADSHYLNANDKDVHETLLCIQTGSFSKDENRMSLAEYDLHLTDPRDIWERWKDVSPEAVLNSAKIAKRCQAKIVYNQNLLPHFPTPDKVDASDYLAELTYKGLAVKYGGLDPDSVSKMTVPAIKKALDKEVIDRTESELKIINKLDFAGYFLIVQDFCKYGKSKGIFFGPARGSAAGSIVSYGLSITEVDPLKYDLLFERFLTMNRVGFPDIDIDIEDGRRDEVIEYVRDKYGGDSKVAHICTFGKMKVRNAIRDAARVHKISYGEADRLAKMVPDSCETLVDACQLSSDLNAKTKEDRYRNLFRQVNRLEGTIRNVGVHPAGVVIAPAGHELSEHVPLWLSPKGPITTQFSMNPVEKIGLLKMDFLGLSNLTIIKNALRIIKKVFKTKIDIANLSLDDKKTYQLLGEADTIGVFQLKEAGVRSYLTRLKPETFEDFVVLLALYRPGPIKAGIVDKYIARKLGKEKVDYPDKAFEASLKNTYGLPVYQEQVMQISRDVCGFDGDYPDRLRKAIGKKIASEMNKLEKKFIEGGIKHSNIDRKIMEKVWEDLVGYSSYAFNKSHTISYGLISYQTAYLKANWRLPFMAALMTSEGGNVDNLKIEIDECRHHQIELLPPDINQSYHEFAVVPNEKLHPERGQIRFGLDSIKRVSYKAVERLIEIREETGPFKSLKDFIDRIDDKKIFTKAILENLIKSGAFDFDLDGNRHKLLYQLENYLNSDVAIARNQVSFFGADEEDVEEEDNIEDDLITKLTWERELLGIYISGHPIDLYQDYIEKSRMKVTKISKVLSDREDPNVETGEYKIIVLINKIAKIWTKSNQEMAFLTTEDQTEALEIPVFPNLFEEIKNRLTENSIVDINCIIRFNQSQSNRLNIDIRAIKVIDVDDDPNQEQLVSQSRQPDYYSESKEADSQFNDGQETQVGEMVWLTVNSDIPTSVDLFKRIRSILESYPGQTPVGLIFQDQDGTKRKLTNLLVDNSTQLRDELDRLSVLSDIETVAVD